MCYILYVLYIFQSVHFKLWSNYSQTSDTYGTIVVECCNFTYWFVHLYICIKRQFTGMVIDVLQIDWMYKLSEAFTAGVVTIA